MTTFGMQDLAELHIILNEEQPTALSAQDELIQWHHCWTVSARVLSRTPSARDCHKPGQQEGIT